MSAHTSASPSHLSIGDVLGTLRDEFPDITISKIRFLESQGLIDPERTPSGYRKFYDADVARLRWILHQQKEHFLPLRVIKERLARLDLGGEEVPDAPEPEESPNGREVATTREGASTLPLDDEDDEDEDEADKRRDESASTTESATRSVTSGGVSMTRGELAKAAGLEVRQVADLESFGLLTPAAQSEEEVLFDEEALAVARAAAGFARHGIEARHLRMYKHLAQREADLFEQVLLPYVRQRNPEARAKAHTDLVELSKLGRALRSALLVSAVREALSD